MDGFSSSISPSNIFSFNKTLSFYLSCPFLYLSCISIKFPDYSECIEKGII